jgi:salicylate hydroxylase
MAEDLKLWKLFYRPPIESWYQGKMVLSGDAAHPMLPRKSLRPLTRMKYEFLFFHTDQGQGGGQAIEDAEALSVLFSCIKSKDEIPQRFQIYQDVRQNRAASMQILSNAGQDEAEKVRAEAQKYIKGPVPSKPIPASITVPLGSWLNFVKR